jgi:hypothetical protein
MEVALTPTLSRRAREHFASKLTYAAQPQPNSKFQISNLKSQTNPKHQIPDPRGAVRHDDRSVSEADIWDTDDDEPPFWLSSVVLPRHPWEIPSSPTPE